MGISMYLTAMEAAVFAYNTKMPGERERINMDHAYYAQKKQSEYPTDDEREIYRMHVVECPPCMASTIAQAARKRIDEIEIEGMIRDIKEGKAI
jgi:hypothetical protein